MAKRKGRRRFESKAEREARIAEEIRAQTHDASARPDVPREALSVRPPVRQEPGDR